LIDGRALAVEGGRLAARGPGRIRWRPLTPPAALAGAGSGGDILLRALTDFRYEALSLVLDGRSDGEMQGRLSIRGSNPALYDGYPIELNVNLEGRLVAILGDSLAAWRVPDDIAAQLRAFREGGR
jgi:hypothetical protein